MSTKSSDEGKGVQLKAKKPKAKPKLDAAAPDPKKVVVSVPKAKTVAASASQDEAGTTDTEDAAAPIKKGAFLDQIVETTGVKRSDAKLVVEAFLATFVEHLQAERDIQIPPLGKAKVVKAKPVGKGATAMTIKIRTPNSDQ
jgi:nucleoid DNA-binding protein